MFGVNNVIDRVSTSDAVIYTMIFSYADMLPIIVFMSFMSILYIRGRQPFPSRGPKPNSTRSRRAVINLRQ